MEGPVIWGMTALELNIRQTDFERSSVDMVSGVGMMEGMEKTETLEDGEEGFCRAGRWGGTGWDVPWDELDFGSLYTSERLIL